MLSKCNHVGLRATLSVNSIVRADDFFLNFKHKVQPCLLVNQADTYFENTGRMHQFKTADTYQPFQVENKQKEHDTC